MFTSQAAVAGNGGAPAFPAMDITFSPTWWSRTYGMGFGRKEDWQDPLRSTEREREQRRLLYERFGDVGLGEADPKPDPVAGFEYGHRFMSAFWGCEVAYFPDQWPHAVALPDAGRRMETLGVPDLETSQPAKLLLGNAGILEARYGRCRALINYGAPLNNAVSVLGEEIFAACAADPELAQRVLYRMGQAVLAVHDGLECRINRVEASRTRQKTWELGNCPVSQISPAMYQSVVRPVDRWLLDQFTGGNSLHHCGHFHPYAEVYRPLDLLCLDVGPGTDLRITRRAYPQARISTYIEVSALARMDRDEVDALVAGIVADAGPAGLLTCIRVAEMGPEISDETVRNLMTVAERVRL
jgi:hypothetical protein